MRALAFAGLCLVFAYKGMAATESDELVLERLLKKGQTATSTEARIELFSASLVGKSYILGPLGEGPTGTYDQNPLYRFDAFDCTTFIETIIALSFAKEKSEFDKHLRQIRYRGKEVTFTERNHFPDLDWMPNNISKKYIEDITEKLAGEIKLKTLTAMIDRAAWYKGLTASRIHVAGASETKPIELLKKLQAEGAVFKPEKAQVSYLSFADLFKKNGFSYSSSEKFFAAIPSGTFFNIVIDRAAKQSVGTTLLIWHQGLFVRKNGELWIRHASNLSKRVSEVPAFDFLLYEFLSHKWDGGRDSGISLFRINPSLEAQSLPSK